MYKMIAASLFAFAATACVVEDPDELAADEQELCYDCDYEDGTGTSTVELPPLPSPPPDYLWDVNSGRFLVARAGEKIVRDVNADPEISGDLTWRGLAPDRCGYACNTAPAAPHYGVAYSSSYAYLKFHYQQGIVSRDITVPVRISGSCFNWKTGAGTRVMGIYAETAVISGGSWIESILDFFSNGQLTAYINAEIAASVSGGSGSSWPVDGSCDSLGVRSGWSAQDPYLDAFTWDR